MPRSIETSRQAEGTENCPRPAIHAAENELDQLENMSTSELSQLWRQLYDRRPPKRLSRVLLRYAVAYRLQERAEGGLSKTALKALSRSAPSGDDDVPPLRPADPPLKPGTRLVREWRGETHQVTVLASGFEYRDMRYRSLSAIARAITGTRWSGPLFFGLMRRSATDGDRRAS